MNQYICMYILQTLSWINIYLYVHGTYMCINVNICMDIVKTHLYSFTNTLHFPSGQISLATLASLSSAQAPLLQSSLLPVISLRKWQTTQALLAPGLSYQPGTRGSVELCPSCQNNWLKHVCTLHMHVHIVYIHVHTCYIGATYCLHHLYSSLHHDRYVLCYHTGINHCVQTGIYLLYTL
jgi:hypothetical protein